MIKISTFKWLVFDSTMWILAAKQSVSLKSFLIEKIFSIDIPLSLHCNVKHFKTSTLPKVVAGVHQFIDTSVESSFLNKLPIAQPLSKTIEIKSICLSQDNQCCQPAESVATVCFRERETCNSALIGLTRGNKLSHSSFEVFVIIQDVQDVCDNQ